MSNKTFSSRKRKIFEMYCRSSYKSVFSKWGTWDPSRRDFSKESRRSALSTPNTPMSVEHGESAQSKCTSTPKSSQNSDAVVIPGHDIKAVAPLDVSETLGSDHSLEGALYEACDEVEKSMR